MKTLFAGNLVLDHITCHRGQKKLFRLGGVANVARAFSFLGGKRFHTRAGVKADIPMDMLEGLHLENPLMWRNGSGKMSKADIRVEQDGKTKIAKVNWEIEELTLPLFKYDWVHLSYLNKIDFNTTKSGLSNIRNNCNILSGDICEGGESNWHELAGQFDYLFMAQEEAWKDARPKKANIIHSRDNVILETPEKSLEIKVSDIYNDVVILGAGDYFAASFIHASLDKVSDEKACRMAADRTPKLLKSLNAI